MRVKVNQQQLSPWQTKEDVIFSESIAPQISQTNKQKQIKVLPEIIENKNKIQILKSQATKNNNLRIISSIQIIKEKEKRLSTVESIIRIKTQGQTQLTQKLLSRKKQNTPIRQFKPLSGNLISLSEYKDQNCNTHPQNHNKKIVMKKTLKDNAKIDRIHRNFSSKMSKDLNQNAKFDIKKLKQTLFEKRNPSLDTLIRAKQQLKNINLNESSQSPILRSYSVHNIKLNEFEYKNKTVDKFISVSKRNELVPLNLNSNRIKLVQSKQSEQIKQRLKSSRIQTRKNHIIDRLYDKFY